MSKFSTYSQTNIIETSLRGLAYPVPAGTFVALCTADPGDNNITANEVSTAVWPAYARQSAGQGGAISSGWAASALGVTSNAKVMTYAPNNGGASVTVAAIGIYDAATGGNLLYHSPLVSSKTLLVGDVLSFGIGAITITVA